MRNEQRISLKEWDRQNEEKFRTLDFQEDILPILKECAKFAMSDTEFKNTYTKLVIANLNIITNKYPMEITYQQYKSFMAYYNHNCKSNTQVLQLDRLGL
jgi:DUF438 domain-containing protein